MAGVLKRERWGGGRGGTELSSRPLCSRVFKTLPNSTTVPNDSPLPTSFGVAP